MTPEQKRERGIQAKQLKENPMLSESLDIIQQKVMNLWTSCEDQTARDRLWYTYQGAVTFRELLDGIIAAGKLSDKEIMSKHKDSLLKRVI